MNRYTVQAAPLYQKGSLSDCQYPVGDTELHFYVNSLVQVASVTEALRKRDSVHN